MTVRQAEEYVKRYLYLLENPEVATKPKKEVNTQFQLSAKEVEIKLKKSLGSRVKLKVSDTQTGLRGMSMALIREHFAKTKGERYEYEMNMLLEAKDKSIPIVEFPIRTIYIEKNARSQFNPFRDSSRIYKFFVKFLLSSFSSFLIDILMFWLLGYLLRPLIPEETVIYGVSVLILTRTVLARVISSIYNFLMNKKLVFRNQSRSPAVAVRYYVLAVLQLTVSALLVNYAFLFIPYSTIRKVIVDTILFGVSFLIQREWVFRK